MKAAKLRSVHPLREKARMASESSDMASVKSSTRDKDWPAASDAQFDVVPKTDSRKLSSVSVDQAARPSELSVRAENVLKELALELTGENPPLGRWKPSDLLLQRLAYKHLSTARNCGPQTIAEIIKWAQTRGKIIQPSFHVGKSLSAMWQDAIARFSMGKISKAEVAEALENSTRRGNTRIPVAFQMMLLQLVRSSNE